MVNLSGLFSCGSGTVIGRAVFEKKNSSEKEIYLNVLGAEAGKGGGSECICNSYFKYVRKYVRDSIYKDVLV